MSEQTKRTILTYTAPKNCLEHGPRNGSLLPTSEPFSWLDFHALEKEKKIREKRKKELPSLYVDF